MGERRELGLLHEDDAVAHGGAVSRLCRGAAGVSEELEYKKRYSLIFLRVSLTQFLAFLAVLSISLGIINLLPIPVLDGGHLVYFAVEGLLGRPLPEKVMLWGQQLGIVFIVLLMGLAFYNDFLSLLS